MGVVDAVPDAGLGREVDDPVEAMLGETGVDLGGVRKVCPYEAVSSVALAGGLPADIGEGACSPNATTSGAIAKVRMTNLIG